MNKSLIAEPHIQFLLIHPTATEMSKKDRD